MPDVFVAGVGMTRVGRRSEPLPELMAEAAHAALAEAGLDVPEGIVVATMNPEEFLGDGNFASNVATQMGFADVPTLRVETATSSGAAALYAAFAQVAAGLRASVLVVGGEKMTHLATPRVSEIIGARSIPTSAPTARRCRPWRVSSRARCSRAGRSPCARSPRWR